MPALIDLKEADTDDDEQKGFHSFLLLIIGNPFFQVNVRETKSKA